MIGELVGKPMDPTGFYWVKQISEVRLVTGLWKTAYVTPNPCSITDMKGTVHSADLTDIVEFTPDNAVSVLGKTYYKMREEDVSPYNPERGCAA